MMRGSVPCAFLRSTHHWGGSPQSKPKKKRVMFGRPRALTKTLNQHEGGSAKVPLTARLPGLFHSFFPPCNCMVNCPGPPAAPLPGSRPGGWGVAGVCVCRAENAMHTWAACAADVVRGAACHGDAFPRRWLPTSVAALHDDVPLKVLTHFSRLEFDDVSKINCRRACKQRFHCLAHAIAQFGLCEFNCKC